ncbi:MAG: purine-binding chemotaxis protein CheW [Symploca sp. SIO3C6]|uniref:Purine-binding chemotaxis protein CheW n=1 Tax=Symploca sp. SIO1C4 TaxID=2607765 RepID=A0A6B3NKL7_9CYAN|nr:purine-binding chemotaxis protein CheW [Symploca sp. SIO3C6]NER29788.1 purine-binding chemotaxis protein CheW [Symploca sp. SIO1C4]NET09267.1 purine-binding chemotaxis protein CheW [Symploca sp. SIO2B6]NET47740.1 purine-binding chemotaxis protein CheW [Merismopedia sp. SIO2A8]
MNTSALALLPNKSHDPKNQGDTYLKFKFAQQIPAVLPMSKAQEFVLLAPERLTAMPNMPAYVMGLVNRRSRVFWVIDLARLLGLAPITTNTQHYHIIIIRNQQTSLGLMVQTVEGVVRLSAESIQSPLGQVSSGLVPYLSGCILQQQEILLALDAEAIIRSPLLQGRLETNS